MPCSPFFIPGKEPCMPELLCPHCLQPLSGGYAGTCPHCGRPLQNQNPEGALPLGTQLAGRYTVGSYLSADGDGLCYRGVLNEERKFVRIKEYFPVTLCNGRNADGMLMPKEGKEVLFKTSRMDFKDLYDDLRGLTPSTGLNTILDVVEENNTVYGIEESEKGMTLTHYLSLRSRTLTPAEARTLLQPVMEGVAQLHKSGLIHRGICPDNILLPIDGTARLTGYGTLALRTGGSELKSQLYPGYAAPEQYSAAEFSGRYTDVYALGAVCYRLVTGQTPVAAPQRKVRDSLESAHSLEAGVPTWFSQVLACALRLDPARRMQTVPELMSALTDPNVANAMFERGDNQISTRKIMGVSLIVIAVLAILLVWSLLDSDGAQTPAPTPTPAAASETLPAQDSEQAVVPDLVGKRHPRRSGRGADVRQRDQGQRPVCLVPHRHDRGKQLRHRGRHRHPPGPGRRVAGYRRRADLADRGQQGPQPGRNARHHRLYAGQCQQTARRARHPVQDADRGKRRHDGRGLRRQDRRAGRHPL